MLSKYFIQSRYLPAWVCIRICVRTIPVKLSICSPLMKNLENENLFKKKMYIWGFYTDTSIIRPCQKTLFFLRGVVDLGGLDNVVGALNQWNSSMCSVGGGINFFTQSNNASNVKCLISCTVFGSHLSSPGTPSFCKLVNVKLAYENGITGSLSPTL